MNKKVNVIYNNKTLSFENEWVEWVHHLNFNLKNFPYWIRGRALPSN